jgi:hypothetical protein
MNEKNNCQCFSGLPPPGLEDSLKRRNLSGRYLFLRAQRIRIEDVALLEVIVVFKAQVGDLLFPHEKTQRVLQLH